MVKNSKQRKDRFYHLAKEQGYRSRAAFKLAQLNKQYGFLNDSKVCLDLCAAPGGWTQVAAKYMPVGSQIIAIDLVAIKPIRGVTTIQADITGEKCRAILKRTLKTAQVDVVLNDGAPNMGMAWLQDAYTQSVLVLASLKTSTEWLKPGGVFVSKVFRSNDYTALLFVLNQFFSKVEATKPSASRNTSAEIYIVASGYLAPSKIDPRLLDPKYVFKDVEQAAASTLDDLVGRAKGAKKKVRNREGYQEGAGAIVFKEVSAVDWIEADDPIAMLTGVNTIVLNPDDPAHAKYAAHPDTTPELKACLADLKVLGKPEYRSMLRWRSKMRIFRDQIRAQLKAEGLLEEEEDDRREDSEGESSDEEEQSNGVASVTKLDTGDGEAEEKEQTLEEELAGLEAKLRAKEKREKRKVRERRNKYQRRVALKQTIPEDAMDMVEDNDALFDLSKVKQQDLESIAGPMGETPMITMDELADLAQTDHDKAILQAAARAEARQIEMEKRVAAAANPEFDADAAYDEEIAAELDAEYDTLRIRQAAGRLGATEGLRAARSAGGPVDAKEAAETGKFAAQRTRLGKRLSRVEKAAAEQRAAWEAEEEAAIREATARVEANRRKAQAQAEQSAMTTGEKEDAFEERSGFSTVPQGYDPSARVDADGLALSSDESSDDDDSDASDREHYPATKKGYSLKDEDEDEWDAEAAGRTWDSDDEDAAGSGAEETEGNALVRPVANTEPALTDSAATSMWFGQKVFSDMGDLAVGDLDDAEASVRARLSHRKRAREEAETPSRKRAAAAGAFVREVNDGDAEVAEVAAGWDNEGDATTLALASRHLRTHKDREALVNATYNRYAYGGETSAADGHALPRWFVEDEAKHNRPNVPVTKAEVEEQKARMRAIDAAPIKKIAEAKGRKKRVMVKKAEKIRQKAEAIAAGGEMSEREKSRAIERLYAKALTKATARAPKKLVVGKRAMGAGSKSSRIKMVDRRMKNDLRAENRAMMKKAGTRKAKKVAANNKRGRKIPVRK